MLTQDNLPDEAALRLAFAAPRATGDLLHDIVVAAMGVVSSEAGALFLLDEARGDLSCRVSIGGSGDALLSVRVPVGSGIVGHVAASEDPLIANDPSGAFANTPWKPRNLLCVPVLNGETLLGALELCDRTHNGAPAPYTLSDAQALGHFVPVAARAIGLAQSAETALQSGEPNQALLLARLVREVSARGAAETRVARQLLQTYLDYVRATQDAPLAQSGGDA